MLSFLFSQVDYQWWVDIFDVGLLFLELVGFYGDGVAGGGEFHFGYG